MPTTHSERQHRDLDRRQRDVEHPQLACGRPDPLAECGDLRPGQLRLHELAAADPEPRENRDCEHDDPHTAEPLRELPPDAERAVDLVEVRDDARAGRRETRHALEVGVDRARQLVTPLEEIGDRREAGREQPRHGDDEEPFAHSDAARCVTGRPLESEAEATRDDAGDDERVERLVVCEREGDGEERGETEVLARASRRGFRLRRRRLRAAAAGRSARRCGSRHSASTTHGAFAASVKMITRSPASRTSSPCGKIAVPLRTIAPMIEPWTGMSRNAIPM